MTHSLRAFSHLFDFSNLFRVLQRRSCKPLPLPTTTVYILFLNFLYKGCFWELFILLRCVGFLIAGLAALVASVFTGVSAVFTLNICFNGL